MVARSLARIGGRLGITYRGLPIPQLQRRLETDSSSSLLGDELYHTILAVAKPLQRYRVSGRLRRIQA